MFDIITFGSATRDILIKPRKLTVLKYDKNFSSGQGVCFPMGSKIEVDDIKFNTGGGGTNVAATFALQGFTTAFCGTVGDDLAARDVINELKGFNIDTSLIIRNKEKPTNHSVIILGDNHDRTILAYRGASELMTKESIPWKKLKTKWIYIAPLTGLLCNAFLDIVNFANEHKLKIAVNPSIAQLSLSNFTEIAKKIDVLILNQEEASFLTKIPFQEEEKIFQKIYEMCPHIAVMTKGGEGVVVSDGTYIYRAKPVSDRNIIDTTGAGDAFGSGFISELMRSGDVEKAVQFGMANSQGCLSEVGAKNGILKKGQKFVPVPVEKKSLL